MPRVKWIKFALPPSSAAIALAAVLFLPAGCDTGPDPGMAGPAARPYAPEGLAVDLDGFPTDPFSVEAKAFVLVFLRNDCPMSNRYSSELRRLHARFSPLGVAFWLIHPSADESAAEIRHHAVEYALPGPILHDPNHILVKMAGARVTPEAAVFLEPNQCIYKGRIDDRFVALGRERPEPTQRDLEAVLESIVEGKSLSSSRTQAVGCYISKLE